MVYVKKTPSAQKPVAKVAPKPAAPVADFDSLAGLSEEELKSVDNAPVNLGPEPTDKDALIAALQAQLAALTAESIIEPKAEETPAEAQNELEAEDFLHFHVLEDGFIAFGKMWYRGQEIRIKRNGPEWESTVDRVGETWLNYVEDTQTQYRMFKKQFFGMGPWPGVKWEDAPEPPDLSEAEKAEWRAGIARAAMAEKQRNGRVTLE